MATIQLVNTGAANGEAVCPPEDVYTLVLIEYGDVETKPVFEDRNKPLDEARMENQVKLTFRIVGTSDDEDEELAGWIGETVGDWFRLPKNALHEKAKFGKLARAILKVKDFDVSEIVEIDDLLDKPFKATISAKDSGWPKIDGFMPARGKTKAAPAPKRVTRTSDEEDGSWPEE